MHTMIRVIAVSFVLLFTLSCASNHKDAEKAEAKRVCERTCEQKQNACLRVCDDSCKECEQREAKRTARVYKTYIHEQHQQGKRVALQLQSFRDPLQCRKSSCDCPADYRVCMSACAGQIYKSLQVAPVCC